MPKFVITAVIVGVVIYYCWFVHFISYIYLKNRIIRSQVWSLNICCGTTDGGGINADIKRHRSVPNFILIENIYDLPFPTGTFHSVLCSHTMEHIDDPARFYAELKRIGTIVNVVLPPLYDITAVLNVFEHKWIFLTFRKSHQKLPLFFRLPLASFVQKRLGQAIRA